MLTSGIKQIQKVLQAAITVIPPEKYMHPFNSIFIRLHIKLIDF